MKTKHKTMLMMLLTALMWLSACGYAVEVTFHESAPTPGPLDVYSLVGAAQDRDNVGTRTEDGARNDATTYVAFDRPAQGQTFVTGSTESIYMLTGVWVQHCGYTEDNTDNTWWSMAPNSSLGIRITDPAASGTSSFILSGETYVIAGTEPNIMAGGGSSAQGTGTWVHFALEESIPLSPNTLYGFDITALRISGQPNCYFELLGIKDTAAGGNPYPAGTAYTSGGNGKAGNALKNAPGDRVFIVELLAVAPVMASLPNPVDKATGVPWDAVLSWNGGLDATESKVYLGTTERDLTLKATIPHTPDVERYSHSMPGLDMSRVYYWRVDEVQADGSEITGDLWSFTTGTTKATDPSPFHHQTGVFTDPELSWTQGINSTESTVYFGPSPDALEVKTTITHTPDTDQYSYALTSLDNNTDYYWRIDEKEDGAEVITGDVWHFKTVPIIAITDPHLVGWWKFDEGSSIAIDWSGLNQHGIIHGNAAYVEGYDESALQFDATDDYVELPIGSTLATLDSATVTAWVNFTSDLVNQRIFDFGLPTGPEEENAVNTYMYVARSSTAGALSFGISTADTAEQTLTSTRNVPTGSWHHVAVTIDGASRRVQFYIDGETAGSRTIGILPSELGDVDGNWLGKSKFWDPPHPLLGGLIDDFRIYNTALTQDDVINTMRGDPFIAWNPSPVDGALTDGEKVTALSWSTGNKATDHDVYMGTDPNAVFVATPETTDIYKGRQSQTTFDIQPNWDTTYYWRIDEVQADGTVTTGKVWSFIVAGYIIVDDFEDYTTDGCNRIYYTWHDGLSFGANNDCGISRFSGNGSGMTVGIAEQSYGPERTIIYNGTQSLPLTYDNSSSPYISETDRTFASAQNWQLRLGRTMSTLSLQLQGRWQSPNMFTNNGNDQYTVIGSGEDIFGEYDEFHFVYQSTPLSGDGSISAQVVSVENTNRAAKAGVMIRNGLEPDSQYAAVVSLPSGDIVFQYRSVKGGTAEIIRPVDHTFILPYWVKISSNSGNFTASMSADGQDWVDFNEVYITMVDYVYAGLAVSSHVDAGTGCIAEFNDVDIQGTGSTLDVSQDIGLLVNDPANLYIRLKDATGATDTWDDPCGTDAVVTNAYRAVDIPLSEFNIDLTRVEEMVIGIGDTSQPGGEGMVYVDDIVLYPEADAN